jgi:putative cell wall-binding protein
LIHNIRLQEEGMKMKKNVMLLALSVVLVIGMLPIASWAQDSEMTGEVFGNGYVLDGVVPDGPDVVYDDAYYQERDGGGEADGNGPDATNFSRTSDYYATLQPDKYSPDSYLNRKPVRTSKTGGYASNELLVFTVAHISDQEAVEIIETVGGTLVSISGTMEDENGLVIGTQIPDSITAEEAFVILLKDLRVKSVEMSQFVTGDDEAVAGNDESASNELTVWTDRYLNNLEVNEIIESTGGILIRRSGVDEHESGLIFDILIPDTHAADEAIATLVKDTRVIKVVKKGIGADASLPLPPSDTVWSRLAGVNRYETMEQIIRAGWSQSDVAIIVTGENFPDALTASSLAGAYDAPIMLTAPDKLSAQTRSLLMSLGVIKAIVVGGPPAVSDKVFSEIQQLVPDTTRIAGPDRFATARMVYYATSIASNNVDAYRDVAIIADGDNYPDALSIAPYAFSDTVPIFLSDKVNGLDADTAMTIKGTFSKIILVGGSNVVPDKVKVQLGYAADDDSSFVRLAGDDRYQTSARIAEYINIWSQKLRFHRLCVTTGKNYPDALAGGVFAGKQGTVLVLADDDIVGRSSVDGVVRVHNQYIGTGSFLGSEAVMPKSLADRFQVAARGLILVEQLPT